mmetsp:Transcript_3656/g.4049  ORF Transcript_3656/g.4049 Transcript_3656/m.4049 type:complete len:189 (-) Transcript_3656:73-639(-)
MHITTLLVLMVIVSVNAVDWSRPHKPNKKTFMRVPEADEYVGEVIERLDKMAQALIPKQLRGKRNQYDAVHKKDLVDLLLKWNPQLENLIETVIHKLEGPDSNALHYEDDPLAKQVRSCVRMILKHKACDHLRRNCNDLCMLLRAKHLTSTNLCQQLVADKPVYGMKEGCYNFEKLLAPMESYYHVEL